MNKDLLITKQDLLNWIDRPPSNDDIDLATFISARLEKFYELQQELQRKDNIINELKKWLDIKEEKETVGTFSDVLDKIKELEESK